MPSDLTWLVQAVLAVAWLGFFGTMVGLLVQRRELLYAFGLGVVAQALAYTPRVLLHGGKPYEVLDAGWYVQSYDARYGEAWPMLMRGAYRGFGGSVDLVHGVHAFMAALWVPAAWALALRWTGRREAAWAAAGLTALSPAWWMWGPTETTFGIVGLLQVCLALGVWRDDRWGRALALCAAILLANLRPLQVVVVGWWLLVWAWRGRRAWALGAGAMVALRGVEIALGAGASEAGRRAATLGGFGALARDPLGALSARTAPWMPDQVLAMVWPLALLGLAFLWSRRRAETFTILVGVALHLLLVFPQWREPDLIRFHLPVQLWLMALAGGGVALVRQRWPRALPVVVVGVGLSFVGVSAPWTPRWTWQQEYQVARKAVEGSGAERRGGVPRRKRSHRVLLALGEPTVGSVVGGCGRGRRPRRGPPDVDGRQGIAGGRRQGDRCAPARTRRADRRSLGRHARPGRFLGDRALPVCRTRRREVRSSPPRSPGRRGRTSLRACRCTCLRWRRA